MASTFTKIIQRQISAYIVAETENCIAFLDNRPIAKGHSLVVPKIEVDNIWSLADDQLCQLMIFAKHVSKGLEKAVPCLRIGMAVIGLEIPHVHIHLVPINSMQDMNFNKPPLLYDEATFLTLSQTIQKSIEDL